MKKKVCKSTIYRLLIAITIAFGGDGGSRTLVQNRENLRLLHAYP